MKPITVLIVDDNVQCRDGLRAALSDLADIEVAGVAPTGALGLKRAAQAPPDVILVSTTLDDMSAEQFTRQARASLPLTAILVTPSQCNSKATFEAIQALEAGAVDFVVKPPCKATEQATDAMKRVLLSKVRACSIRRYSQMAKNAGSSSNGRPVGTVEEAAAIKVLRARARKAGKGCEAALIGVSTGGPEALAKLIPALPASMPVPVLVVLHMPETFTAHLAEALDKASSLRVKEAAHGDEVTRGTVYLAAGGKHLALEKGTRSRILVRIEDGPAENGCKPSVDVFFRSAAAVYKGACVAVVLTGMGEDGTRGLAELRKHEVPVLVQDEASSVVWGMPGSAVRNGLVDEIVPLARMAARIVEVVNEGD